MFLFCLSLKPVDLPNNTDLVYKILSGENQQNDQLIIVLHGMNSNTAMWNHFVNHVPNTTLLIAVEAPIKTKKDAYRWYDIDVSKKPFISNVEQMTQTTSRLNDLITLLKAKYKIKTKNTILAGFSQGAILSINLALTNQNLIHGIGVFSGMLPYHIESRALKKIKKMPVFIAHGSEDKGIAYSHAKKTMEFLTDKGAKVNITIEKSGHVITDKQFHDFLLWAKKLHKYD